MKAVRRYGGTAVRFLARRWSIVGALAFLTAVPPVRRSAEAQEPARTTELIDRVVAVVGNTPILMSEVNERLQQARAQGMRIPEDSAAVLTLQRQFLQQLVDDEVLYQQARRDTTITVSESEIQGAVDEQFRGVRGQFRTDAEFTAALQGAGLGTVEEYRRYLGDQSRRENYRSRYVQKMRGDGKLRPGTLSDAEMREFFTIASRSNQLDSLPPTITFRQIIVTPRASDAARAEAIRLADSVRTALEHGANFAETARRFSDDPGSKENGGDLGFFRRGTMVRQFEEVAFNLRPGIISPLVRTDYGYHIILVERVQTGEIKARHILFTPRVTAVEQAAARAIADSLAVLLHAGASFDSLARIYSDSNEPRVVGPTNRDSMPAGYAGALAQVTKDQVVGPAPLAADPPERTRWMLARITDVQAKRLPTFEDVRDQVRQRLIEQKGLKNLLDDLKRQTYVDMRL